MAKRTKYTSIITGDLIKSRNIGAKHWLPPLRKVLSTEGETPRSWEIFRGDSFQIEIKDPSQALLIAIRIKATLKCIKHLDVRMAIGIGEKDYAGAKITESNGNAFIFSGEKLEEITREKQNLGVRTPWPEFDREMNLYFRLALVIRMEHKLGGISPHACRSIWRKKRTKTDQISQQIKDNTGLRQHQNKKSLLFRSSCPARLLP
jgi:hypothetical protein